jgi:hypothetical protein
LNFGGGGGEGFELLFREVGKAGKLDGTTCDAHYSSLLTAIPNTFASSSSRMDVGLLAKV